jgi:hypothetical protein
MGNEDRGIEPLPYDSARLVEHPGSHFHDHAIGLGNGDELAGRDHGAVGLWPTHKRLETEDLARARRCLDLEMDTESMPIEGLAESDGKIMATPCPRIERWVD